MSKIDEGTAALIIVLIREAAAVLKVWFNKMTRRKKDVPTSETTKEP